MDAECDTLVVLHLKGKRMKKTTVLGEIGAEKVFIPLRSLFMPLIRCFKSLIPESIVQIFIGPLGVYVHQCPTKNIILLTNYIFLLSTLFHIF